MMSGLMKQVQEKHVSTAITHCVWSPKVDLLLVGNSQGKELFISFTSVSAPKKLAHKNFDSLSLKPLIWQAVTGFQRTWLLLLWFQLICISKVLVFLLQNLHWGGQQPQSQYHQRDQFWPNKDQVNWWEWRSFLSSRWNYQQGCLMPLFPKEYNCPFCSI